MWLLVGGDSELGAGALAQMRSRGREALATTRRVSAPIDRVRLDLSEPLDGWEPPPRTTAACIFAAAARLAACSADPVATSRINVTQTLALTDRLIERGIYVLFLSTNQVFDGRMPRVPADTPTKPVSEYGRQKARTEAGLRDRMAVGAAVGILRLAKVVSPTTPLLRDWRSALAAGKPIRAFHDMTMAPTPVDLVHTVIGDLLKDRAIGIFQLTGPRDVPYTEFGRHLAAHLGADPSLVTETSVREAGLPDGVAPPHTTLDTSLLHMRYGIEAPDVWQVVKEIAV
jgi:dTDP-4-dehydrorhamnose reductase